MTDEIEPPSGNLPAVIATPIPEEGALVTPNPGRVPGEGGKLDQIIDAIINALTPDDFGLMTLEVRDIVAGSKSDPARVAAAKLIYDRFVPDKLEHNRRDAEERNDAIIDIRRLLAELGASLSDGREEPAAMVPNSAQAATHPKGS